VVNLQTHEQNVVFACDYSSKWQVEFPKLSTIKNPYASGGIANSILFIMIIANQVGV